MSRDPRTDPQTGDRWALPDGRRALVSEGGVSSFLVTVQIGRSREARDVWRSEWLAFVSRWTPEGEPMRYQIGEIMGFFGPLLVVVLVAVVSVALLVALALYGVPYAS